VARGIGAEIIGYRIDSEVGRDGMGVVCLLAEQASRASDEDV